MIQRPTFRVLAGLAATLILLPVQAHGGSVARPLTDGAATVAAANRSGTLEPVRPAFINAT
ncbi:MAG: hypothetical protein ABIS14_06750, partial [Sphingomonas sp.]